MKFRLMEKDAQGNKTSPHVMGAQRFLPGMVIESDKPLDRIFRNKFERVDDNVPASKPEIILLPGKPPVPADTKTTETAVEGKGVEPPVSTPEPEPTTVTSEPDTATVKKSKHGMDVTEDFENASLAGLNVYAKNGGFIIVDVESDVILKRAKTDSLVTKFISKQLG